MQSVGKLAVLVYPIGRLCVPKAPAHQGNKEKHTAVRNLPGIIHTYILNPGLALLPVQSSTRGQADFTPSKNSNRQDISENDPLSHCV